MKKKDKIYIAGHHGLVGSAIVRRLKVLGYSNLIFKTHTELDLLDQTAVTKFFQKEKPDHVFLAAAKVGGINANNSYPADFIYQNLQIQNNIIYNAYKNNVKKLLFLGSSCIYPKKCPQPMKEKYLLSGYLEPTNESYAIAKIAGLKMCEAFNKQYHTNFISVMPTNLYGPEDNFDLKNSHVLPALIKKFTEAFKEKKSAVTVWGSGKPKREFLFVDDLADAVVFLMNEYSDPGMINIGTGTDISIKELAELIAQIIKFKGKIIFDRNYPDGTSQKLLDISKIRQLGWSAKTTLKSGIEKTIKWYSEKCVS